MTFVVTVVHAHKVQTPAIIAQRNKSFIFPLHFPDTALPGICGHPATSSSEGSRIVIAVPLPGVLDT